jgi:hypothetical protein
MPRLFDLLSENTDDETISELRKIAGKKTSGTSAEEGKGREKARLDIPAILSRIDFVALDLETTGL